MDGSVQRMAGSPILRAILLDFFREARGMYADIDR
jgi:hypothetical protein